MAKVTGYSPDPDVQALIDRSLQPNWTSETLMIELRNRELSRQKLAKVQGRSLLNVAGAEWRSLPTDFQDYFKNVGLTQKVTGWVVALMQYCAASKLGYAAIYFTPPQHAGNAACFYSPELGELMEYRQGHPLAYYVPVKVPGTKSRRMPQQVFENYPAGVELKLMAQVGGIDNGWFVDWSDADRGGSFEIKIIVRHYRNVFRGASFVDFVVNVPHTATFYPVEITGNPGIASYAGYDVIVRIRDFRGLFLIDTLELNHGGNNYAKDWRCKTPNARFTSNLAVCAPNWEAVHRPTNFKIFGRGYQVD